MLGDEILDLLQNQKKAKKIKYWKSGFKSFDNQFKGIPKYDVTLIAARKGMGTTDLCLSIVNQLAKMKSVNSVYLTFESTRTDILLRFLSMNSGVKIAKLKEGISEKKMIKLNERFGDLPIAIYDHISPDGDGISKFLTGNAEGTRLFVIDSLNNYKFSREQCEDLIDLLQKICATYKTTILLTYHLDNSVEQRGGDKRPGLEDLNQFYFLKNCINTIIFLYRPKFYGIVEDENGKNIKQLAELILSISLDGKTGIANLKYQKKYCKFKSLV